MTFDRRIVDKCQRPINRRLSGFKIYIMTHVGIQTPDKIKIWFATAKLFPLLHWCTLRCIGIGTDTAKEFTNFALLRLWNFIYASSTLIRKENTAHYKSETRQKVAIEGIHCAITLFETTKGFKGGKKATGVWSEIWKCWKINENRVKCIQKVYEWGEGLCKMECNQNWWTNTLPFFSVLFCQWIWEMENK